MSDNVKKTILVADDTLASRAILHKVFAAQYEVLEAENGRKALDILRARPDVAAVLLDIVMPEMDGFAVLAAMQASEALAGIPVVVMTASADEETKNQALACGAMDVLNKPINPYVTQKRVENLIERMDAVRWSERTRTMETALREAETDVVSGLYNKNAFLRRARQYLDEHPNGNYILMRWDIDNFKVFNDVYGTETGDEYLRRIGDYYRSCGEKHIGAIFCVRYEADHFICLHETASFNANAVALELQAMLKKHPICAFDFTPRIGLYHITDNTLDVSLMCDRALLALRSIKNEFGVHYAWYANSMRDSLMREHEIVSEMKDALAEGQFQVYFQPQYNYMSGALIGAEALVRWHHPKGDVITPGEFIPIFERNGFIYELDSYVWEKTCELIKRWKSMQISMPPISVSVNISRKDLYQPDMVERICALPQKYGVDPAELHLEITESAYIDSPEQVVRVVTELQQKGFAVEMDDFGSGFSSLNTLKNVPVDMLKLDMEFLAHGAGGSRGGIILSSVVRMAHEIDLPVIAEGVETRQQAEYLKSIGCRYMQGYFFSKPVPADEFERLLMGSTVSPVDQPDHGSGVDGAANFMDMGAQTTLLFNSFVGGAAILEYSAGNVAALRINDQFYEVSGIDRQKYTRYRYHLLECLTADSRTGFTAALDQAIATGKESECEACALSMETDGDVIWAKCRFRYLTRKVESYLFYMSLENITERKNLERELEREKNALEGVVNSIPGGVATYEMRPDGAWLVYASDGVGALTGRTPEEFRAMNNDDRKTGMYPPDEAGVQRAIQDAIQTGGQVDITYRVLNKNGELIWLNLYGRAIGKQNGYPLFYAVYHNLSSTTELYRRILDETENALFVADRKTHEILFVNDAATKLAGRHKLDARGARCYAFLRGRTEPCEGCVVEQLEEEPITQELNWDGRRYFSRITRIDWNGHDAYSNYIADRTDAWNRQKHADEILNNLPGGAVLFRVENGRCLREYLSDSAFAMLGYEKGELPSTDMLTGPGHVHPEDRIRLQDYAMAAIEHRGAFDIDMRIVSSADVVRWVNLKANPVQSTDGVLRFYGQYSDINARKHLEEELCIREQEYRLAAEQSGVFVCRYYIKGRVGKFNRSLFGQYATPADVPDMPDYTVSKGLVVEEDVENWREFFRQIDSGAKTGGVEIRLMFPDGGIRWISMRFTGISGDDGRPFSAVVSCRDITEETERLLNVRRQADMDGMTGLLNHMATERTIEELLRARSGMPVAFLLLDVDNLKHLNDAYGHPQGDRALIGVAHKLSRHFRSTDVIGRIGGDEFVALLPGMADEASLSASLNILLEKIGTLRVGEANDEPVCCSIGCALQRRRGLVLVSV